MTTSLLYIGQVKAERFLGAAGSAGPDDAVPQADRERVVAGALIQQGLAGERRGL